MRSVECAWRDVVEAVVVDARQPVGAIWIGPDPALERVLDLQELRLRRLGVDDVEHAPLAVAVLDGIEDLRHAAVERVGEELTRMTSIGAPLRCAGRRPAELPRLDGPRRELRHVVDLDLHIHRLLDEGDDVCGRNPRCAETRRDVGRFEIGRLHALQRRDVALVVRLERCGGLRRLQFVTDGSGQVGIGRLPRAVGGIAEDGASQFGDDILRVAMQELGDVVDIDVPALVEHNGERVGRAGDHGRRRRRDHPLGEERTGLGGVGLEVVVLDRGDEPAVGIVEERLDVWPTVRFPHFAGLLVFRRGDSREIDRTEVADEARPGDAQPDLRILPRPVELLVLQHLPHGVADGDQLADDADVLLRNAFGAPAFSRSHRDGLAVEHLHQAMRLVEEVAALAHVAIGRQVGLGRIVGIVEIEIDRLWLAVVDRFRKKFDGSCERLREVLAVAPKAYVGLAEGTRRERVRTEHEIGMPREPAVHADRALVLRRGSDFLEVEPRRVALGIAELALAEEQEVDDDICAGGPAKAALRQTNGCDEVRRFGDVFARGGVRLVHRAVRGDEGGQSAGLQEVDRARDEVIMQAETLRSIRAVRSDGAVAERRVANREVEARRQLGSREVAGDDPCARLQQAGDARRDRIELDAGDVRDLAQSLRHQRGEEARADAGLKHAAATPAQALQPYPDRADNELGREVRVLGAARERGVVEVAYGVLQVLSDRLPALAKLLLARTSEREVG